MNRFESEKVVVLIKMKLPVNFEQIVFRMMNYSILRLQKIPEINQSTHWIEVMLFINAYAF
jgi:hypothetical protein